MRNSFNLIISGFLGAILIGCSSISVNHSYDPAADFSRLKSFGWMAGLEAGRDDELTLKNIQYSVKKQLAGKGVAEDQGNPDFLIAIHGGREKKVDVQQWGYAYADRPYYGSPYIGGRGYGYAAPPTRIDYRGGTDIYEYEVGTLILDFVDPGTKELIWRGTATAVVDDPVSPEKIDQAVSDLLENFPPSGKQ
jgi:hypothetical protein